MVRNMSPENSNPKPEEARPLSRQERIEQLRQNRKGSLPSQHPLSKKADYPTLD